MADLVDLIRANVRQSRRLAKEILDDPLTAVLDTETTGLNNAFIVDLAVIARGKTLINTLIDPGMHIPEDSSRIHGIYDKDVKGKPTFAEVWPEFEAILRKNRIVIYTASYDLRVISNDISRLETPPKPPFNPRVDDAMVLYQTWYFGGVGRSGKNQTKLVNAHCDSPACVADAEHHAKSAHRAYADCLATVRRLKMIADTCWLEDHYRKATSVRR
jgi:DNA polymerase III epsilon subunit-like protein